MLLLTHFPWDCCCIWSHVPSNTPILRVHTITGNKTETTTTTTSPTTTSMTEKQLMSPEPICDFSVSGQCRSICVLFWNCMHKVPPSYFATAGFKISMGKECTSAAETPAIYVGFTSVLVQHWWTRESFQVFKCFTVGCREHDNIQPQTNPYATLHGSKVRVL